VQLQCISLTLLADRRGLARQETPDCGPLKPPTAASYLLMLRGGRCLRMAACSSAKSPGSMIASNQLLTAGRAASRPTQGARRLA
jgi:hypothetical protein